MPIFLPLNLQFFSADLGDGGNPEQGQNPGANPDQGQGSHKPAGQPGDDGSQKPENMIPLSRFNEVNTKYKDLEAQLAKFAEEKEQADLEAKKKKGEFEDLYNTTQSELETYKSQEEQRSQRVGQLEGIIQTLVDTELEAVPEDLRDLVPSNFTPEQKLEWITNAKKKGLFGASQSGKAEQELGGSTNNQPPAQTDVSKMSVAQLLKSAYGSK